MNKIVIVSVGTLFLLLFAIVGSSTAALTRRPLRIRSDAPSPVLTSVIELDTTISCGEVTLVITGLTAAGKRETIEKFVDSWTAEEYHLKWMSDPRDGYWEACDRILLVEGGTTYIIGYQKRSGDSDDADTDVFYEENVAIPFDFDVKTQRCQIHIDRLAPLPVRFREQKWAGLRFVVPVNLKGLSKDETKMVIEARGGQVVDTEGPVDVVVLPDRVDFCPSEHGSRNRIAERWIRKGAKVLWERYFGRPNAPCVGDGEAEWRD